jgi:PAS domain S-box-containing protein
VIHCRGIWTLARRGDELVFGPESYEEDDPLASPPGTVYEQPTDRNRAIFFEKLAFTEGPDTDEYGSFISALAPVLHPRTGDVLVAVGLDIETRDWLASIGCSRLSTMLAVLVLGLIVLAATVALDHRKVLPEPGRRRLRYAEAWVVAAFGLAMTVFVSVALRETEIRSRKSVFSELAESRASSIAWQLAGIREFCLRTLAGYLGRHPETGDEEFRALAAPFLRRRSLEALAWAPAVLSSEMGVFEERVRREGHPGFALWERGAGGLRIPPGGDEQHFPIRFIVSENGHREACGYDLVSEPVRRVAVEGAIRTGLTTGSDSVNLVAPPDAGPAILAMEPVYAGEGDRRALRGVVVGAIRLDHLLSGWSSAADPRGESVVSDLLLVAPSAPMVRIASSSPESSPADPARTSKAAWICHQGEGMETAFPLFVFGRPLAMVFRPGSAFLEAQPLRLGWVSIFTGAMLTTLLAVLAAVFANRRAGLESEVLARTADLRRSEEHLSATLRSIGDGVVSTDGEGRVTSLNLVAENLSGWAVSDARGRPVDEVLRIVDSETGVRLPCPVHRAIAEGRRVDMADRSVLVSRDLSRRNIADSCAPIRAPEGDVIGAVLVFRDVTSEHLAREAVRVSEARMRAISDSAHEAILMMDPGGRISYWNPAAERILGYPAAEAMGRDLHLLLAPERHLAAHRQAFTGFVATGQGALVGKSLELEAVRKDGREIHIALSLAAVRIEGDWHAVGILRDVSEVREAREALLAANRQLEETSRRAQELADQALEASRAKGEFLANVSHEIRTPMNGIIGMTGLLLDTELTAEQRQYTEIVRSSGEALLALINDILDFSKIEAKRLELENLDFDLRVALEDATELLAVKAFEKGLDLVCIVDADVPSMLRGDPGRIRQIVLNLGGNAVKFTHTGGVTIRAALEAEDEKSVTVRFSVTDTGIGIPAGKQSGLFSPFTQVDASSTRQYGGTGLGLAISRELVELMGGRIGLESEEGGGSTFWFALPLEKAPASLHAGLVVPAELEGVRVLSVDDSPANRLLVRTVLRQWGCRVEEAVGGADALRLLAEAAREGDPVKVALLDMQMPGMDGETLGRKIRASRELEATRLILMTSIGDRGDAARLAAIGFEGYLTKPLRHLQLRDCLALVLAGGGAGTPAAPRLVTRHTVEEARRRRTRILVAEDNATNQLVVLKILERLGYPAEAVANGEEALAALGRIPYDLVLMDCQMPVMDGFEATRRIRAGEGTVLDPRVPIIAVTAHASANDRARCLAAGMNDYLSKPLDPTGLMEVIHCWLPGTSGFSGERLAKPAPAPAMSGGGAVIFDRDGFLARVLGDRDLARTVSRQFIDDMPAQLDELAEALVAGDFVRAARQAHRIKGAAANVGGEVLREGASGLESAMEGADLAMLGRRVDDLRGMLADLAAAMEGEFCGTS